MNPSDHTTRSTHRHAHQNDALSEQLRSQLFRYAQDLQALMAQHSTLQQRYQVLLQSQGHARLGENLLAASLRHGSTDPYLLTNSAGTIVKVSPARVPMKLLLVDDSKLTRSRLHSQLGRIPGITSIVCAGTQDQARTSILHERPTLAILHLHLPVGLGTEIIAILKSLMPNLLIAVLTIHVNHSYRETCLTQGADWFFDKTTEFHDLLAMLSQHAALSAE